MEKEPLVGIVVVNYCSFEELQELTKSFENLSYTNWIAFLIDNNSPDGSGARLPELESDLVRTVLIPENRGFAAGANVGMHLAGSLEPDFIWLLNPDVKVEADSLGALVDAADKFPEAGAFGSKVLYGGLKEDQAVRIWSAGGSLDIERQTLSMRGFEELDDGSFDDACQCDYLPGCSLFLRTALLEDVGYLPEEYFLYFEETEWCLAARRAGYTLQYVPSSRVWHVFRAEKMQEETQVYYYNRNSFLFWSRFGAGGTKLRKIISLLFRDLPRIQKALMQAPDHHHRQVFKAHRASVIDFLLGRFGKRLRN